MINRKDIQNIESLFMLSAIKESKSKRKAAEYVGSSVDTLNKYIKNLEEELGFSLVVSSGQGCKLTPKGISIMKNITPMKEILFKIYNEKSENNTAAGLVKVGLDIGVSASLPLLDINEFLTKYPHLQIESTMYQDGVRLEPNNLDIGISYNEPKEKDVVILATKVMKCKLFASPNYLAQNGYPKDVADLVKNHWIVCKYDAGYYNKEYKEILKHAENIRYTSNSSSSLIDATQRSAGICVMPMRFTHEGLVSLDNFDWVSYINIYLYSHKKVKDLPRVRAVINYIKEIMEKM